MMPRQGRASPPPSLLLSCLTCAEARCRTSSAPTADTATSRSVVCGAVGDEKGSGESSGSPGANAAHAGIAAAAAVMASAALSMSAHHGCHAPPGTASPPAGRNAERRSERRAAPSVSAAPADASAASSSAAACRSAASSPADTSSRKARRYECWWKRRSGLAAAPPGEPPSPRTSSRHVAGRAPTKESSLGCPPLRRSVTMARAECSHPVMACSRCACVAAGGSAMVGAGSSGPADTPMGTPREVSSAPVVSHRQPLTATSRPPTERETFATRRGGGGEMPCERGAGHAL